MHDPEPDPRREAIRDILAAHGITASDDEIDSVIASLDRQPRCDGWRWHKDIAAPFGGSDPLDT